MTRTRLVGPVLLALLLFAAAACSSSSTGHDKAATSVPSGAAPPPLATSDRWDSRAVWDWSKADNAWREACNASPVAVRPNDTCVLDAMSKGGASQQAVDFYKQNGYFLYAFTELGKVDHGRGSAPWQNMGRPTQQLFLNGQPSLIDVSKIPDDWKEAPSYADLVKREPNVFPWPEYGTLTPATTTRTASGGQSIEIAYPLLVCRACANLGLLTIAYEFDASGKQTSQQLLPLKPA